MAANPSGKKYLRIELSTKKWNEFGETGRRRQAAGAQKDTRPAGSGGTTPVRAFGLVRRQAGEARIVAGNGGLGGGARQGNRFAGQAQKAGQVIVMLAVPGGCVMVGGIGRQLVLFDMVSEVLNGNARLVQAIVRHCAPGSLQGEQTDQKEGEPATHERDYSFRFALSCDGYRPACAAADAKQPAMLERRACETALMAAVKRGKTGKMRKRPPKLPSAARTNMIKPPNVDCLPVYR
jgi:hypothetical protein